MTNLDIHPAEIDCRPTPCRTVEIVSPRDVPLGGIRAMTVRRTLPARGRPFIGSWCFLDHYGPDDVAVTGGMDVAPHPHTGLATVSWLFRGEIEHRDSLGTRELVLPGELNLMTAGHGIAHSEVSTKATTILHGVQLWLALPPNKRDMAARFEHYAPESIVDAGTTWRVFLGELGGITGGTTNSDASPIATHTPTMGAEVTIAAGISTEVELDREFEYGVLVDQGRLLLDGRSDLDGQITVDVGNLAVLPIGGNRLRLTAVDGPVRALLIGGAPMETGLVMWWNFIGESHEEIVESRRAWQEEIAADSPRDGRFGKVLGYDGAPLPAPQLPGGRLKQRQPKQA